MASLTDMHKAYEGKIFINYLRAEDHPVYKMFQSGQKPLEDIKPDEGANSTTDAGKQIGKNVPCDEIFYKYLNEVADKVNRDYFLFVFKFVILFRECLNKYRTAELNTEGKMNLEYTQVNNAENAPDLCNEFITDFMEAEDYFGLDTNELIEIIQHLCFWLYQKGYTSSRLTLLSN